MWWIVLYTTARSLQISYMDVLLASSRDRGDQDISYSLGLSIVLYIKSRKMP